jgi:hypothetical protein
MQVATAVLSSKSLYSQSRPITTEKKPKETHHAFEARTWHERLHLTHDGSQVVIPGNAFRNCIAEMAKYLSIPVPGKGKSTYTKHFEAGILVPGDSSLFFPNDPSLPIIPPSIYGQLAVRAKKEELSTAELESIAGWKPQPNEVVGDWIFTPSDGIAGSGKRVWKSYPIIPAWTATVEFIIADEAIDEQVFTRVLRESGDLIGIGRYRVRNRGSYGRFRIESIDFKEVV